jgi:hypothetical protein
MASKELEIVAKELEKEILSKLNLIKDNVLTKSIPDSFQKIEILAMVSDELSDVILNWDPRVIENDLGDDLL